MGWDIAAKTYLRCHGYAGSTPRSQRGRDRLAFRGGARCFILPSRRVQHKASKVGIVHLSQIRGIDAPKRTRMDQGPSISAPARRASAGQLPPPVCSLPCDIVARVVCACHDVSSFFSLLLLFTSIEKETPLMSSSSLLLMF